MSTESCSECNGITIKHRGSGWNIEVWVCPYREKPGHLTRDEAMEIYRRYISNYGPQETRWA